MLAAFFSFHGRLGRLAYFGWSILFGIVAAIGFGLLIFAGFTAAVAKGSGGAILGTALLALLGLIPVIWASLALVTKRVRDAGFPPLVVVPAMMAFSLFDMFVLSRHSGGQMLAGLPVNSNVGMAVNLAYGVALLLWPSAGETGDDDGTARHSGEVPWHERALSLPKTPPPAQIADSYQSQVAMPMPQPGQPRSFGKRRLA